MTLVDSSAWIEFLRPHGNEKMKERVIDLLQSGEAAINSMIFLELSNGARGEREKLMLKELESVLSFLPINDAVWEKSWEMAQSSRKKGKTYPSTDILIAACAQFHGALLIHNDLHLKELMEDL